MQRLRGSLPAIITPMKGSLVDLISLESMVSWLLEQGVDGIVACGTTGEGATLSEEEVVSVVRTVKATIGETVPLIVGTGSNDTWKTVALTKKAADAGADAALIVTPYYNKPTSEGLFLHYEMVAQEGGLPVIMYNVPGRTAICMDIDTIFRCSQIDGVVGIKDASKDMALAVQMRCRCKQDFSILSGDDFTILPFLACGGDGVITVVGNVVPGDTGDLIRAFECGDLRRALELQDKVLPLADALFVETSPIPVKAALSMMGKCDDSIRMPLTPASSKTREVLRHTMLSYGGML